MKTIDEYMTELYRVFPYSNSPREKSYENLESVLKNNLDSYQRLLSFCAGLYMKLDLTNQIKGGK